MTLTAALVVLVSAAIAYANGANDVSKGIATLAGSGVTNLRKAVAWGAVCTGIGALLGALFAGALLATFGDGLLIDGVRRTLPAALAMLTGAAGAVALATRLGLPVSTTHAIVGALVGVVVPAYGVGAVRWAALGEKVALPLLLSPVLSFVLTRAILKGTTGRTGTAGRADCLCAGVPELALSGGSVAAAASETGLTVALGRAEACAAERPHALRLTLAHLHWVTSGATSLARGMNDAPKIVALSLGAWALGGSAAPALPLLYGVVAAAMVAGSLLGGLRVSRVLAQEVTPMDDREGFSANLVTAALVATGAMHGLPMSTTHVAAGGIFGAGAHRGTLDRRALRDILLAWVVTLPAAALLGAGSYALAAGLGG